MLGHATIETLNRDIDQLTENIAQLEQQLAIAREERKQKEAERQGVQTLIAAGQSSLDQAEKYLAATTQQERFDLVESFWEEMDKLRGQFSQQPIADLPPASEPDPVAEEPIEPQPAPEPDGNSDEDAVEEAESETIEPVSETEENPELVTEVEGRRIEFAESNRPVGDWRLVTGNSVGAAALDLDQMSKKDIERECLTTKGLSKAQVKEHGPLTRKSTWIAAYRAN